jgi:hypothetical protein
MMTLVLARPHVSTFKTQTLIFAAVFMLIATVPFAQAQNFQVLHTFEGPDGSVPSALAIDKSRNLFGVTSGGGTHTCTSFIGPTGCGTAFELSNVNSLWIFNSIYQFQSNTDGWDPAGPVTLGTGGLVFGVTDDGGKETGPGTAFSLRLVCGDAQCNLKFWKKTTLNRFGGNQGCDGWSPNPGLVLDGSGNLYGTTYLGCPLGNGVVYELSPAQSLDGTWKQTILHHFQGPPNDGNFALGGVIFDRYGNLFGTTKNGGVRDAGTAYQLTPNGSGWTETVIWNFNGPDEPIGSFVFGTYGNGPFGVTCTGWPSCLQADVIVGFKFENSWSFPTIYEFNGPAQTGTPSALSHDSSGNLYGTLDTGGVYGQGNVFELINGETYIDLYDFTGGSDGAGPAGPPVFDANGNLYGSANLGGDLTCNPPQGCGTVWMLPLSQQGRKK